MAHVELLYFWKWKQACSNLFLIATFEAKQMESSHVLHLLRCLGQLYESDISMVKSMNHPHFFHGWLTLVPCKQALFSVVKSIMFQLFSPPFFLANSMNPPFFSTIFARSSQFFHGNHPNYSQELGAQMREEALKGARPMGALLMVKSEAGTPFCFVEVEPAEMVRWEIRQESHGKPYLVGGLEHGFYSIVHFIYGMSSFPLMVVG